GGAAAIFKVEEDGSRTLLDPIGDVSLEPGEWVAGNEAGGGGYGDPLARELGAVAADVREGYVSVQAAREQYGVVLDYDSAARSVRVDEEASALLRQEMSEDPDPKPTQS